MQAELTDVALFGAMQRYGDLCIHAVIDLRRDFQASELERAVRATFDSFPVLAHRYVTGAWRDRWAAVETPMSDAVRVEDCDSAEAMESRTNALVRRGPLATRDRQLRVVGLRHAGRMRFVLSILHLAVDGAGIAAVGHVLGSHLYGVAPAAPVEARRDVWRVLDGLRWFHWPVVARSALTSGLRPLRQLFAARRTRQYASEPGAPACWRHVAISAAKLSAIRARCHGATVNDIIIAAMACVAAQRSSDRSVVVSYTMDNRRYGSAARLVAANSSSILAATVPRDAIHGLERTTAKVAEITARDRKGLAGPAFMVAPLPLAFAAPHALARVLVELVAPAIVDLPLDRGLLMTNVGRVDHGLVAFGDDIEDLRIVGPNVEGVAVPLVVVLGFRGGLRVELYGAPGVGEAAISEMESELRAVLGLDDAQTTEAQVPVELS